MILKTLWIRSPFYTKENSQRHLLLTVRKISLYIARYQKKEPLFQRLFLIKLFLFSTATCRCSAHIYTWLCSFGSFSGIPFYRRCIHIDESLLPSAASLREANKSAEIRSLATARGNPCPDVCIPSLQDGDDNGIAHA